jgi:hypothetical protein
MNPADIITLEAFLTALLALSESVPNKLKVQLKQLGSVSSANIGELEIIAESHPPLYTFYREARRGIRNDNIERTKGPLPDPDLDAENLSMELTNLADQVFSSPDPVSTIQRASNNSGVLKRLRNLVDRLKT